MVGRTTGLLQARVPFEPVLRCSLVDDLDHFLEDLTTEEVAGFATVADALQPTMARVPTPELLVRDVGAAGVALTVGDDDRHQASGIAHLLLSFAG